MKVDMSFESKKKVNFLSTKDTTIFLLFLVEHYSIKMDIVEYYL